MSGIAVYTLVDIWRWLLEEIDITHDTFAARHIRYFLRHAAYGMPRQPRVTLIYVVIDKRAYT